jgi:hypothetical protein
MEGKKAFISCIIFIIVIVFDNLDKITATNKSDMTPDTYIEECTNLIIKCNIQTPKKQISESMWTTKNWGTCSSGEVKKWMKFQCTSRMKVYDTNYIDINETLAPDIYQPVLTVTEYFELMRIYMALNKFLAKRNIPHTVVFGTLLGSIRNNVLILPWDDDIDIAIPTKVNGTKSVDLLTKGLKSLVSGHWCKKSGSKCQIWEIEKDVYLSYKHHGIPLKVTGKHTYPGIDVNTFDLINETVTIPKKQLVNGHIHNFIHDVDDFYPLQKYKLSFSGIILNSTYSDRKALTKSINISIPNYPVNMMKIDYGDNAMDICKTSYNHHPFCSSESCENPMANHIVKAEFPCALLPENFFHHHIKLDNKTNLGLINAY